MFDLTFCLTDVCTTIFGNFTVVAGTYGLMVKTLAYHPRIPSSNLGRCSGSHVFSFFIYLDWLGSKESQCMRACCATIPTYFGM